MRFIVGELNIRLFYFLFVVVNVAVVVDNDVDVVVDNKVAIISKS